MNPHRRANITRREAIHLVNRIRVKCGRHTVSSLTKAIRVYLADTSNATKYNEMLLVSYELLKCEPDIYNRFIQFSTVYM